MVVPVAIAQQLTRSFRATIVAAMVLGMTASLGGLVIAALAPAKTPVAPGPTIVLLALAGYVVAWPVGVWTRHRARLREPFPADVTPAHEPAGEHPHAHGPQCGHLAVPHDDHVDYVHDGHRHAEHGAHYDEH
jgi:zinc transport system permease protein